MKLNFTLIASSAGAKSMAATKVLRGVLSIVKHMVVADVARI
jgi:hypothetical protein